MLRNIAHLLAELGEDTPVELVVHGPGLAAALAGTPHAHSGPGTARPGGGGGSVRQHYAVQNMAADQLIAGVRVVPAVIAQLVRRQREGGWAYVRP